MLTSDMRILLSKVRPPNRVFPDKRKKDHNRKVTIFYLWASIFPLFDLLQPCKRKGTSRPCANWEQNHRWL